MDELLTAPGSQGVCHGRIVETARGSAPAPIAGLAFCPLRRLCRARTSGLDGQRRRVVSGADQRVGAGGGGGGGGGPDGGSGTRAGALPGAAAGGSPQRNASA